MSRVDHEEVRLLPRIEIPNRPSASSARAPAGVAVNRSSAGPMAHATPPGSLMCCL